MVDLGADRVEVAAGTGDRDRIDVRRVQLDAGVPAGEREAESAGSAAEVDDHAVRRHHRGREVHDVRRPLPRDEHTGLERDPDPGEVDPAHDVLQRLARHPPRDELLQPSAPRWSRRSLAAYDLPGGRGGRSATTPGGRGGRSATVSRPARRLQQQPGLLLGEHATGGPEAQHEVVVRRRVHAADGTCLPTADLPPAELLGPDRLPDARWTHDHRTRPPTPDGRRPAHLPAAAAADHRARQGGRRPGRQPALRGAPAALGRGPASRHQPLHQQPGWLGDRRPRDLRHDADDPQRRQHAGDGPRGQHGPVPALGRHAREALRAAARTSPAAPGLGRASAAPRSTSRSRPRTSSTPSGC